MAIGVKVVARPDREVSYLRAALKGMALTFSHIMRPKVTMQYPEEKSTADWSISPRWRGTHRMLTDEQGRAKCVACGLCPQVCPDRKSTRLNSSHSQISYAVFCLKKKNRRRWI